MDTKKKLRARIRSLQGGINGYGFEIIRLEAERDALRAALQEARDVEEASYLLATGRWPDKNNSTATWRILSRAIDTKEK